MIFILLVGPLGCTSLGTEARLVLEDIGAGTAPSALKKQTPSPSRELIRFHHLGRAYRADIYRPREAVRGGIILVPGLAEAGKDDFRLVAFATTLARARFLVLVPDIKNLRQLRIGPEDSQHIADNFHYLQSKILSDPRLPLGIGAFSYAAGPTILAAMRADIQHQVDFVLAIGGYYDLRNSIRYFTTGYFDREGKRYYLSPHPYGKLVFALSTLELLSSASDRRLMQKIVHRKLMDRDADVSDLSRALSKEGERLYQLLTNERAERAFTLLANLPPAIGQRIAQLNLANKDLKQLKAKLILVHGKNDNIIPYSESIALAAALGHEQAQLFIIEGMTHIDVISRDFDQRRMWEAIRAFLSLKAH